MSLNVREDILSEMQSNYSWFLLMSETKKYSDCYNTALSEFKYFVVILNICKYVWDSLKPVYVNSKWK